MAQVTGGTTFNFVAQRKHEAAQKILSRAADIWATSGRDAISHDSVIAVLLHIYLSKWEENFDLRGELREEARTLEKWLPLVGTAKQEAEAFLPPIASATITEVLSLLNAEISFAAEQWCLGNSEQPPTAQALNAVEHILFTHKLIHRPASPKLPKTVRET